MINTVMRTYNYFTFGNKDKYGQASTPNYDIPAGTVKIAIYTSSQAIQDNIRYKDATYIGLTHADITDNCVIEYGEEKLKVLYVNPQGRYKQVFLKNI